MAQLPGAFSPQQHGDMNDFSAFPAGSYHLQVVESEIKMTKKAEDNNDPSLGQMLVLKIEVIDGKHKGRLLWERLNIINPNADTQKIANENLATLCRAVGFDNGLPDNDTSHLHGKPFDGKVGISKGTKGYADSNKMQNYKKYGSTEVDVSDVESQGQSSGGAVKLDTAGTQPKGDGGKPKGSW